MKTLEGVLIDVLTRSHGGKLNCKKYINTYSINPNEKKSRNKNYQNNFFEVLYISSFICDRRDKCILEINKQRKY